MKFSIGIPAYKSSFIRECIESVLSQTYPNFELIIVNDASPEPIDEIITEFKDSRIKYFINEQNIGAQDVVKNWNKCLDFATGDYFVLLGDDDKLEPDYLQVFKELIDKYSYLDVFHCRSKIINSESVIIDLTPSWPEFETIYDNIWHRISGLRIQYISDFVYNVVSLKQNQGFYYLPLAWGSDDITAYRQIGNKGIAHSNNCVLNYRNSPITLSNSGNIGLKLKAIQEERNWFENFIKDACPFGNDIVLLKEIKKTLPVYFSDKTKYTLSLDFKKGFFIGLKTTFSETRNKTITIKEGSSVILSKVVALVKKPFKKY